MSSAFEGLPKTPNLKLNKPGYDNVADIEALNENADILDAEIQGIKNTFVKSVNGINAGDDGNVDLGIIPIANGGTGATTAENARKNLGANDFVTGLSVSGKTITYNKKDGSQGTITTQDTVYTHPTTSGNKHIPSGGSSGQILRWSADGTAVWGADNNTVPARYITSKYSNGSNWYEVYNDGWIRQGGIIAAGTTATFLKPFTNTNYTLHASPKSSSSGSAVTWAQGTPQNKKNTSFQTNGNGVGFEWIAEGYGA